MKKRIIVASLIVSALLLSGCFNETQKNGAVKNIKEVKTENGVSFVATEDMLGADININTSVNSDNVKSGNLVVVSNNGTRVSVAGKNIKAGDVLFTIENSNNVALVSENIVTEKEFVVKNSVNKRATPALLGDFDATNKVDIADFIEFAKAYGTANAKYDIAPATSGVDLWTGIYCYPTPDGKVDINDFITFAANYSKVGPIIVIVNPVSIAITMASEFTVGTSDTATAVVAYSDGKPGLNDVTWESSDTTVITVDSNGKLVPVKAGTAIITAKKGSVTSTKTVTVKDLPSTGITVYVEKPDSWGEIWMWYDADPLTPAWDTTTIKTAPGDMKAVTDHTGWYQKDFTTATTTVTCLFNDGTWNNKLNANGLNAAGTTGNFTITAKSWVFKDGKITTTSPWTPQPPAINAEPAGGEFSSDTIDVKLTAQGTGVTVRKYTTDGSDAKTGKDFTEGQVITIGSGLAVGQSVTVSVYSLNSIGESRKDYKFTKTAPSQISGDPNDLRIYQVYVSTFQDKAPVGYTTGYGPGPFGGDIRGIIDSLDYIKGLGMNAIWLTPIFDSNGGGQLDSTGYFCYDYFSIDPKFGSFEDAQEMVQKAHDKGMYVFFDGVFGHHKGGVKASPTGKYPSGAADPVAYPASMDFYKEVATYWIDKLEIDGWRLDQAYQVNSNPNGDVADGTNYWGDIRKAVEAKCTERRSAGKKWGTLGYMVGEIWKSETIINAKGYGNDGLRSCFDFPFRYRVVQTFAIEENGQGKTGASNLSSGYTVRATHPSYALPNMFLSNHDLYRFGDLIDKAGLGDYWKRHKAAHSFINSVSGPMTIYYGDEYGLNVPNEGNYAKDCVSRMMGKVSGFGTEEQDLINYVTKLMNLRANHPALSKGTRTNLIGSDDTLYADLKVSGSDKIVYVVNVKTSAKTATISQGTAGGTKLRDLITGTVYTASGGNYSVSVDGLTGLFLQVE